MSTVAAAAQIADRIDYWIRRHVIPYCYATHPSQSQRRFNPARDRRVGLLAIGQCLKEQYDALWTLCPGISLHSSSSSKRRDRKTHDLSRTDVNRRTGWRIMYIQRRHWLDYDPVALAVLVIGIGMIELLALII
jgi:hypothetical protein